MSADGGGGAGEPSLVRPYTLTAGRTDSQIQLSMEAVVSVVASAPASDRPAGDVRGKILALSVGRPSVAEIAAHLALPLGVARVLVADLVVQGYLTAHGTLGEAATADERRELIGRTLRGLRALQ